jgi:hypothetical protein
MNLTMTSLLRTYTLRLMLAGLACTAAQAQWSILAPGTREPKPNNHRNAFLVYANPVPGREVEFNEWYQNTHMGDLVQRPGFIGAQRFRIVTEVNPKPTQNGYAQGYLIFWDTEDADPKAPVPPNRTSPAFGTSRILTYQAMGGKITRPDGKGPTMPADDKTFRFNRYILMDAEEALPGKDAEFNKVMDERIRQVLALPGWMAVQRFSLTDRRATPPKQKYLTVWETEGLTAQEVNTTLMEAMKSGSVKANPHADMSTAEMVYWIPISPYITREDFAR